MNRATDGQDDNHPTHPPLTRTTPMFFLADLTAAAA
jgi:hypothetical protein